MAVVTFCLYFQRFSSISETRKCDTEASFSELFALIECEQPTADLYRFIGRITIQLSDGTEVVKSLGPENLLLRSSRLKNTAFVFGEFWRHLFRHLSLVLRLVQKKCIFFVFFNMELQHFTHNLWCTINTPYSILAF